MKVMVQILDSAGQKANNKFNWMETVSYEPCNFTFIKRKTVAWKFEGPQQIPFQKMVLKMKNGADYKAFSL